MSERSLAYLCLQATLEGQASYAHVHEIIGGLEESGWEVDLFEPHYAGKQGPGPIGRLIAFAKVHRRWVRALRSGNYDAVYVRGHALAWPSVRAAHRMGLPVIQECNGPMSDFYVVWPLARIFAPLLEFMAMSQFRSANGLIAVTHELAEWLGKETGRVVDVIGNGANTALFHPEATSRCREDLPKEYAVLFGALSKWQSIDVAVAAAESPEWPGDVALVLAGDGLLREFVDSAASRSERIIATGNLPYQEVPGVVAGALCSLVLSRRPNRDYTGSPLKMYESMACGVPIIVANVPVTSDTVREHDCGVIVDPLTPEALARAVAGLYEDRTTARRLGANGRAAAEAEYSWEARARATREVIVGAIDRYR